MTKVFLALCAAFLITVPVGADGWQDQLTLSGYGNWHYGESDGTAAFAGATPDGAYDNIELILSLSAQISPTVSAYAQVSWGQEESFGDELEEEVDFEIAAVRWEIHEYAKLHFGRSRIPFGLYTELWDAGIARPFVDLPQSVYGPSSILGESYDGIGVSGTVGLGDRGWGLSYDAYLGEMSFDLLEPGESVLELLEGNQAPKDQEEVIGLREIEVTDLLGVKLLFETPVSGLHFGFSAYRGDIENGTDRDARQQNAYGFQVEYLAARWTIRAEAALSEADETRRGEYLEVAYQLDDHWSVAGRYVHLKTEEEREDIDRLGNLVSLLEHDEISIGINYLVNEQFLLKASYHFIDGNHLAIPVDFFDQLEAGTLEELDASTGLLRIGVSFSF